MTELNSSSRWVGLEKEERTLRARILCGPDYWKSNLSSLEELHSQIANRMTDSFEKEGWPTIPAVGWEEALAAAQLITRCVSQPVFMRECLPSVEQAYRFGGIPNDWFAEFYDTIMYFENKPQIFGTVLDWTESLDVGPWRVFEPEKLGERRSLFSLKSHEEDYAIRLSRWKESSPVPPDSYLNYLESLGIWAKSVGWKR